jgi:DNA-directed RNA polymerase subunit M/transcription elongation factor TFIIS
MLNYFCPKCGGKNLYQFQKPKFCSHCGESFSIASSNIKSNQFEVSINTDKKRDLNNSINQQQGFEEQIQDYS